MGTWGTSLFDDDTAADVRDDYRDLVASGLSDNEALAQILKKYLVAEPDIRAFVEPLFWLALARTQWEIGRLDEETKSKAIHVIESGTDIEKWKVLGGTERDINQRAKMLSSLRKLLESPQKSRKKLRPKKRGVSRYSVGDVVSFRLSDGRFVLLRVTSIYRDRRGEIPVAEILDWVGTSVPPASELASIPSRRRIKPNGLASVRFPRILLTEVSDSDFDPGRLAVVACGLPMPQVISEGFTVYEWRYFEQQLSEEFGLT